MDTRDVACEVLVLIYYIIEGAFDIEFGYIRITEDYRYIKTYRKELELEKI
jgi:hypothetical protein